MINNIRLIKPISFFLPLLFLTAMLEAKNTDTIPNPFGLKIIRDKETFILTTEKSFKNNMLDLSELIPSIVFDLKYATNDNFMHQVLYPQKPIPFARYDAAMALVKVQAELQSMNMGLKIWDSYRPYSVTELMWEKIKDERYTANPKYGSGHNRGVAIDLTIIEWPSKKELDMGTAYDNFTDTAHHDFKQLPDSVLKNRQQLRQIMEKNGFVALETEWWHYFLIDINQYDLLDFPFSELKKVSAQNKQH